MQDILPSIQDTILGNTQSQNSTPTDPQVGRQRARGRGTGRIHEMQPRGFDASSKHYCYTHGLTRSPHHTSQNCRETDPGHKKEAIFYNRMGGYKLKCNLANNVQ